jgi:hypothetical protein
MRDGVSRIPLLLGGTVALACVGFAAFTGHIWEDYFITFRSSLNLATGHGLVFQPGERVHTFTSPLGTLLPALFALGGGEAGDVAVRALWSFRVASALALGAALWLCVRTWLREHLHVGAIVAAALAWALDAKIIDYAINGMESAWLVLFVALTWFGFSQANVDGRAALPPTEDGAGRRSPRRNGDLFWCAFGFAGLQWTRPDGGVFFAVMAAAWCVFSTRTWRERIGLPVRAALLGLALYLPWVVFAWVYYGTPIPHTIMAKVSQHTPGELLGTLALYPWRLLFGQVALHDIFLPAYWFFGGWPDVMSWTARIITLGAALAWGWPRV